MRKLLFSLLAVLFVTTSFAHFHHSFHHSSSHHSSYHHSSYSHPSYHSMPSHHIETAHPTYRSMSHIDASHISYHPLKHYYYYLLLNNHTHVNDTIKANTKEDLEDKVIAKTNEEDGINGWLIFTGVLGVAAIVGVLIYFKNKE